MSGRDDSGRIPPPKSKHSSHSHSIHTTSPPARASTSASSSSTTTTTTPNRRIFPGFLSTTSPEEDSDNQYQPPRSPSPGSPTGLPYLRDTYASSSSSHPIPKSISQSRLSSTAGKGNKSHGESDEKARLTQSRIKKRPAPLNLVKDEGVGVDEELSAQRDIDPPLSAISITTDDAQSTLSNEMQHLSLLRQSVRQNLMARPVDSPLGGSDSDRSSGAFTPGFPGESSGPVPDHELIDISSVIHLLRSTQTFVLDTRPLGEFLQSHLPRSANVSIPSLIFKRFKKQSGGKNASWNSLGSFVSTPAGTDVWESVNRDDTVNVVVVGLTPSDETARVLRRVVKDLIKDGQVKILRGGWASVLSHEEAVDQLVSGDFSTNTAAAQSSSSIQHHHGPRSASKVDAQPPPSSFSTSPPRISQRPSLPSLRLGTDTAEKRNVPTLSLQPAAASTSRRPPKLSLNLDKPLRSATLGPSSADPPHTASSFLPIPTGTGREGRRAPPPGLSLSAPKSPFRASSFQTLCHEQSKLPPSPSSFGDVKRSVGQDGDMLSSSSTAVPGTPWTGSFTARPGGGGGPSGESHTYPTPATPGDVPTARQGLSPFVVSTILPSFLFLGPEIASTADVETLKSLGVKRILNVAIECDDEELKLKEVFDKYMKVPMRDIVEESGVAKGMRDACNFLDDARLHSAPTYVHCKAGRSRSVTVVLAYLIHANAWTLKTAYAYVSERRRGISPNIGFVAELMQFEEAELGLKQSGGVHGEGSGRKAGGGGSSEHDKYEEKEERGKGGVGGGGNKSNPRYMRESLPPTWAHSLDSSQPRRIPIHGEDEPQQKMEEGEDGRRPVADEREVRKNGQWVHHRRAPVDRTTLQPGRRVSKAGLESLRPLASASTAAWTEGDPRPSPQPSPKPMDDGVGDHKSNTPGGEGRLGWI